MDTEIKIGRDVEGVNVCRVPAMYSKVSRFHAILQWRNGVATLMDNGSSNGTFVNGRRITSCQVSENDTVWLGGNENDGKCYQLDLRKLLSSFRVSGSEPTYVQPQSYPRQDTPVGNQFSGVGSVHGNDYSREFERLKQAYIGYHEEYSKLTKKANTRMQLPRILLSLIPALLGLTIMLVSKKDMTIRIVAVSAGSVLSGLVGTLTMGKGSKKKEKLTEDILDLQLKYQKDYKCPKCGKAYNLDLHWKKIQAEGKCPYGCGAQF